jgi:hypothetical protein
MAAWALVIALTRKGPIVQNDMTCTRWWGRVLRGFVLVLASATAPTIAQDTQPNSATVANALAADIHTLTTEFLAQRDAVGGWPARVQTIYDRLSQGETLLQNALSAGNWMQVRRRYQECLRVAAPISRWLSNRLEPANEEVPPRERVDAVIERLSARLALIRDVAARNNVVLNVTEAQAARQQLERARANGTDAQLRAAARALRDAIDTLQDVIPDPEN